MDALKRTLGLSPTSDCPPTSTTTSMVIVDRVGSAPVLEEVRPVDQSEEGLQVRDRLVNLWNNVKFSKTMWSLESSGPSRLSKLSPAWLLGQSYHKSASSRSSSVSEPSDDQQPETMASPLALDFQSRIWMTYRKDFQCFPKTAVDTDCGWGCMIR